MLRTCDTSAMLSADSAVGDLRQRLRSSEPISKETGQKARVLWHEKADQKYFDRIERQFSNAPVSQVGVCCVQTQLLPVTHTCVATSRRCDSLSYVVSVYAHYYHYAKEIISSHLDNAALHFLAMCVVELLGLIFRITQLDYCIFVNNWLLSTNLWPSINWTHDDVLALTEGLLSKRNRGEGNGNACTCRHRCAIVWRSVDETHNSNLVAHLRCCGYLLIPARVINYMDPWDRGMLSRTAIKSDCKCFWQNLGVDALSVLRAQNQARERGLDHLGGTKGNSSSSHAHSNTGTCPSSDPAYYVSTCKTAPYELVFLPPGTQVNDLEAQRIIALYNQLYLDKYSKRNPQLTPTWVQQHLASGFLTVVMVRQRHPPYRIEGVIGYWSLDRVMTTPLFGYELEHQWLYKVLSLVVLLEARRNGYRLVNASGGANHFKRQRGARTTVEFNAVYVAHLPWWRKLPWQAMSKIGSRVKIDQRAK